MEELAKLEEVRGIRGMILKGKVFLQMERKSSTRLV